MRCLLAITLLFSTTPLMAGFFGGLDIEEITDAQEKAFQAASACVSGSYLDACDDLIKYYRKSSELLSEHESEISEGIRDGNSSYQRVVDRARRLQSRIDAVIRLNQ